MTAIDPTLAAILEENGFILCRVLRVELDIQGLRRDLPGIVTEAVREALKG